MDASDNSGLPLGADALTRRNRKRGRSSIVNGTAKRTRDSEPSTPVLVRRSISDLVSNASPRWESVNGLNTTPSASPNLIISKGKETWREAIVKVLKESRDGLTTNDIVSKVRPSLDGAIGQDKARAAVSATVSAALSAGAKGDKPLFEKRGATDKGKTIWALSEVEPGSSSRPINESSGEHFVPSGLDSTAVVATPPERESDGLPSVTNDGVSGRGDQSLERAPETNGENATTPPDSASVATAQKIDYIIRSAGLSPRADESDGPPAGLKIEPSGRPQSHELQQISPPSIVRQAEPSARDLQPSVHGDQVTDEPVSPPVPVADDRPVVAVRPIAVEEALAGEVAREVQEVPNTQESVSSEALGPLLAAAISGAVEEFNDRRRQELPALDGRAQARAHSTMDVRAAIDTMLGRLGGNSELNSMLAQPAILVERNDPHRALDDLRLAREVWKRLDAAESDCDFTLAKMNSLIAHQQESIAVIMSIQELVRAPKEKAKISQKFARDSINAFIRDQDDDDQTTD